MVQNFEKQKEDAIMDSHQLEDRWNEIKGELKSWWGKLTDDDIEQVAGNRDKLIGVVQQKYGYLYDEAQREIDRRLKEFDERTDRLERTSKDVTSNDRELRMHSRAHSCRRFCNVRNFSAPHVSFFGAL